MDQRRRWVLGVWVLSTLAVAYFHEPWRDEAQAWLVARSAHGLGDLLYRSALEATGPLYYLALWPLAQAFPAAFPDAIFWFSWLGALGAASWWLLRAPVPFWAACAVAFGYLLGYEYPTLARHYGWGCWLLVLGVEADLKDRTRAAAVFLSLACLVQLNFLFAVGGWMVYRLLEGKSPRRYSWVAVVGALSVGHLLWASKDMAWQGWVASDRLLTRLGTTLGAPFLPNRGQLGVAGVVVLALALWPLSARARWALAAALVPFVGIFVFRYGGIARSRHGGALFVLWLLLLALTASWDRLRVKRVVQGLLGLSLLGGLVSRGQELARPYAGGQPAAQAIAQYTDSEGTRPRLISVDDLYGFVVAAQLNADLWTGGAPYGCPFFAGACQGDFRPPRDPWTRLNVDKVCPTGTDCFFVGHPDLVAPLPVSRGRWEPFWESRHTLSGEDVVVYRLSRR